MRSCFALLLVFVVGCSRTSLNVERTFDADGIGKTFNIEPVSHEQTIKVVATAEGGTIDAFVYLTKNRAAAEVEIMRFNILADQKLVSKVTVKRTPEEMKLRELLAKEENTESVQLQATIPAHEEVSVKIRTNTMQKPKVKLRITN